MATINWEKIKAEIQKLTDVDYLSTELNRIANELKKFDVNAYLSPTAKTRLKDLEKRYSELLKGISKQQRQFDREFNKVVRSLKTHKTDIEKKLKVVQAKAKTQKAKVESVGEELKKKVAETVAAKAPSKKKVTKKKVTKKTTTKKTTGA